MRPGRARWGSIRRGWRIVLGLVASVLLLGGCESPWSDARSTALLTRHDEGGAEMNALNRGILEIDPDSGCVLLSGRAAVWPAGTTLTTEPPELHLPGGLVAHPGDAIAGGGGVVPAATIRESSLRIDGDVQKALRCAQTASEIVVFSARGDDVVVTREGSGDRLAWASTLGRASEVQDAVLAQKISRAARASGARLLEVTVLQRRDGRRAPVVTLEASDPASYMKHDLRGFLTEVGFFQSRRLAFVFVELLDEHGRFAWSAGRFPNGGMVHPRADLDQCSPIHHSQLAFQHPPPCPAD